MITTNRHLEKSLPRRVYHGYVASRTLVMPEVIAELESKYPSAATGSEDSRRSSIQEDPGNSRLND